MKKISLVFASLITTMILATSCSSPNSGDSENKKAKYTVMLYGAGGGNLDPYIIEDINNMNDFCMTCDSSQINITINVNFSSPCTYIADTGEQVSYDFQENPELRGTVRGYISKDGLIRDTKYEELQTLHDPDTLTDFINYSKTYFPAEKYILIFDNHGSQFSLYDQPVDSEVTKINGEDAFPEYFKSRAVIADNNNGNNIVPLSIFGIEEGIKNSGLKMEVIYFYCCLMGQIENLYQLRNQTNYILSSGNISYSSNLKTFLESLCGFESTTNAMKQYMNYLIGEWQEIPEDVMKSFFDISLSDMSKWDNFIKRFIKVKEALIKKYFSENLTTEKKQELYQKWKPAVEQITISGFPKEKIPEDWNKGQMYYYDFIIEKDSEFENFDKLSYTDIDLSFAFKKLSEGDAELTALVTDMETALDELLISSKTSRRPEYFDTTSVGLFFANKNVFTAPSPKITYKKYNTLESIYTVLDWDKVTKWSDFILKYDF